MAEPIELTGVFQRENFRFENADGDTIIAMIHCNGEINGPVAIKGKADQGELAEGLTYRFMGDWTTYKNRRTGNTEEQFHFTSFCQQVPHGRAGVIAYLKNAGEGYGLGNVRATKLWEIYGSDAVDVCRERPEEVCQALYRVGLNLSEENAKLIAANLTKDAELAGCTLDLIDLLNGRGFPRSTYRAVLRQWGNRGASIIKRDPYKLMNFYGCGFRRCDQLYLSLKLDPGRLKRQTLCAWYACASNTEGHTWHPRMFAVNAIKGMVSGAALQIEKALRLGRVSGATKEISTLGANGPVCDLGRGNTHWIAEGKKARNEIYLAFKVAEALLEPNEWPSVDEIEGISDHQREELQKALVGPIAILGGGPGCGKTYTAAALIKLLIEYFGSNNICIMAPTGKAAVRLTEVMNAHGLEVRARTIHSALVDLSSEKRDWHNELSPHPAKVMICDEQSMTDTDLMASIFRARSAGTMVLLIGDVNQLAPVGHGAPLRDLIAAGVPYGELKEIKRNSGGIVETCQSIRENRPWNDGDNLHVIEANNADAQKAALLKVLRKAKQEGFNPIWDCQPLAAVNAKSPLARKPLNELLQKELNHSAGQEGVVFLKGDKVVNTKNGWFTAIGYDESSPDVKVSDKGEVYVANGELGEVVSVEEKIMVIKLTAPDRTIRVPMGKPTKPKPDVDDSESEDGGNAIDMSDPKDTGTGCTWELGYCLSVHKSQGSEWPVVIILLDEYPGARMVCDRAWIYTAISRAKAKCYLIGKKATADRFCRVNRINTRKTFLKELILKETAKFELAEM